MTDSKTPEWVKEAAFTAQSAAIEECVGNRLFVIAEYPFVTGAAKEVLDRHISQALLSAYERGRKEGIEEAAKVAGAHQATPRLFPHGGSPTENEAAEAGQEFAADEIEYAIRQLLEVKG